MKQRPIPILKREQVRINKDKLKNHPIFGILDGGSWDYFLIPSSLGRDLSFLPGWIKAAEVDREDILSLEDAPAPVCAYFRFPATPKAFSVCT